LLHTLLTVFYDCCVKNATGTLYIVATPIGNLEDITLRALRVLKECDLIIAEDTRRSRQLLAHYGIEKPFERSLYRGVERERVEYFIEKLKAGAQIALICDAGTPLISDPGYGLVRRAIAENISIVPIPGPTALITALIVSGFPTESFVFAGVPPKKPKAKREFFAHLSQEPRTILLYESPHRVLKTLEVMAEIFPNRPLALCRELTKMHEEIVRGTVQQILDRSPGSPDDQRGDHARPWADGDSTTTATARRISMTKRIALIQLGLGGVGRALVRHILDAAFPSCPATRTLAAVYRSCGSRRNRHQ
jgi:16S rRNA (cytidine1402-2'-O)-methyltransferase